MRVLRSTFYVGLGREPATTVMRDSDLRDTIESAIQQTFDLDKANTVLALFDVFEMPDGSVEDAGREALERQNVEQEDDMAVLFFWTANEVLPRLREDGLFLTPDPAPLTVEQITTVFEQLAKHPNYDRQTLSTRTQQGEVVELQDGKVVT